MLPSVGLNARKHDVAIAPDAAHLTKGERSKRAFKEATRRVFQKVGYANARVQDITTEAGFSNGAFYRYFEDKHEIMMNLLRDLLEEAYKFVRSPWDASHPTASVYVTTFRYLTFYRDNADLFRVLVEASQNDEEVASMWAEMRDAIIARISHMLERASDEGLLRETVDIPVAAGLLAAMTDHYAYLLFIAHRGPDRDIAEISEQISTLWAHGVLQTPATPAKPHSTAQASTSRAGGDAIHD